MALQLFSLVEHHGLELLLGEAGESGHAAGGDPLSPRPVLGAVGLAPEGRRPRLDPRGVVGLLREGDGRLAARQSRAHAALAAAAVARRAALGAVHLRPQGGPGERLLGGAVAEGAHVEDAPEGQDGQDRHNPHRDPAPSRFRGEVGGDRLLLLHHRRWWGGCGRRRLGGSRGGGRRRRSGGGGRGGGRLCGRFRRGPAAKAERRPPLAGAGQKVLGNFGHEGNLRRARGRTRRLYAPLVVSDQAGHRDRAGPAPRPEPAGRRCEQAKVVVLEPIRRPLDGRHHPAGTIVIQFTSRSRAVAPQE